MRVIVIRVPFPKVGNTFSERERVTGEEPARAVARRVVARPVFQVAIVRATRERQEIKRRVALLVTCVENNQ